MSNKTATANSTDLVKLYQSIDEEGVITSKYKSLLGSPKNYRFDGRTGDFKIGATTNYGRKLKIQPISFRFMTDELFARKDNVTNAPKRELWIEIFFVDEKNCVSYIMFNNSSARAFQSLIEEIYYDDLELTDLVLSLKGLEKKNDKGAYYVVEIEYDFADKNKVEEYRQLCEDVQIFSRDTITQTAEIGLCSKLYPVACLPVNVSLKEIDVFEDISIGGKN